MLFIIAELRKEKKMNNNVKVSESKSLAIDDKNNPEVRMSMSVQIKSYGLWFWNILDQTQTEMHQKMS